MCRPPTPPLVVRLGGGGAGFRGDTAPDRGRLVVPAELVEERTVVGEHRKQVGVVLGGGLFPGAVILIGGAPGIGKSTLLLQVSALARQSGARTLYVSGEESSGQIRQRAERL